MSFDFKRYIKEVHGGSKTGDITDKNNYYDYVSLVNNRITTFELKERTGDHDDILIEAWQSLRAFGDMGDIDKIDNCNINNKIDSIKLHKAMGWFYKIECDRLIYVMPKTIYDFDWINFRRYILSEIEFSMLEEVTLNYCGTTSKTINYVIQINKIPIQMYIKTDNRFEITQGL